MSDYRNYVKMTVTSAVGGTGTITLNADSSGYRSFATAYGADATVDVLITEGSAWEVARNCTYTHSGTTLTRGTLENSSTGSALSLTSAATVEVVLPAAAITEFQAIAGVFGSDVVSITGATTLTSAAFGKIHHCTGTSANYTVGLPAASGNAGKLIGFRMGSASGLTKLVTIDGNASETIDGATTRVMWATETAVIVCDGSNWFKLAGRSVPMLGAIARTADQTGIVSSTITKIACDSVIVDNTGTMADTVNNRVYARRTGTYVAYATGLWKTISAASANTQVRIHLNNAAGTSIAQYVSSLPSGAFGQLSPLVNYQFTAGDYIDMRGYQETGSNQTMFGDAQKGTYVALTEIPSW